MNMARDISVDSSAQLRRVSILIETGNLSKALKIINNSLRRFIQVRWNHTFLLSELVPVGDLSAWGIAHLFPVVQRWAGAAGATQLQSPDDFVLSDAIPIEQHQL